MPVVKPGVPRRELLVDQCAWTPRCALKVPAPLAGREALGVSGINLEHDRHLAVSERRSHGAHLRAHEHDAADDPDRGEGIAAQAGARTAEAIVPASKSDARYSEIAGCETTDDGRVSEVL